ncbi:radical SAM protein [Candidatus Woesearchaeota archaeon]|nr:radical SAM protein [Candidatus Woesearchaeota archaeon]
MTATETMQMIETFSGNIGFALEQLSLLERIAEGAQVNELVTEAKEILDQYYSRSQHKKLTIGVNDKCNLTCAHCYYASTHDRSLRNRNVLTLDDWNEVIREALSLGIRQFSIAGKEPLLSHELTFGIIKEINKQPDSRCELLTNGTLINENIAQLRTYKFSPLVISFDGSKETHDKIRGKGSYERAKAGLMLAQETGVKNIAVTYTAMHQNVNSLSEMIQDLSTLGVKEFGIAFCASTDFTKTQPVSMETFYSVLQKLAELDLNNLSVSLHLPGMEHARIIAELYRNGEISEETACVPSSKIPRLGIFSDKERKVVTQIELLPMTFYSRLRIDCDGSIIGDYEGVKNGINGNGVHNIRTTSLEQAWNSTEQSWQEHATRFYQNLTNAFAEVQE